MQRIIEERAKWGGQLIWEFSKNAVTNSVGTGKFNYGQCFKNCFNVISKKISNDQELIQSDPTSCPQNQKGNNSSKLNMIKLRITVAGGRSDRSTLRSFKIARMFGFGRNCSEYSIHISVKFKWWYRRFWVLGDDLFLTWTTSLLMKEILTSVCSQVCHLKTCLHFRTILTVLLRNFLNLRQSVGLSFRCFSPLKIVLQQKKKKKKKNIFFQVGPTGGTS